MNIGAASWILDVSNLKTCKKRRIDFPLFRNVEIQEVKLENPIGNSDHASILINTTLNSNLSSKTNAESRGSS